MVAGSLRTPAELEPPDWLPLQLLRLRFSPYGAAPKRSSVHVTGPAPSSSG